MTNCSDCSHGTHTSVSEAVDFYLNILVQSSFPVGVILSFHLSGGAACDWSPPGNEFCFYFFFPGYNFRYVIVFGKFMVCIICAPSVLDTVNLTAILSKLLVCASVVLLWEPWIWAIIVKAKTPVKLIMCNCEIRFHVWCLTQYSCHSAPTDTWALLFWLYQNQKLNRTCAIIFSRTALEHRHTHATWFWSMQTPQRAATVTRGGKGSLLL